MTRWLSFRMAFEHVRFDFRRMILSVLAVVPAGLRVEELGLSRVTHNVSFAGIPACIVTVLHDGRLMHDPRHRPELGATVQPTGGRDP